MISGTPATSGQRRCGVQLPSDGVGCGRRRADVRDRESAELGDVQHHDGSAVRHADGGERRHVREHRDQRQRRQGDRCALPAFAIAVTMSTSNGSATLSWTPPTQNTDGIGADESRRLSHLLRHRRQPADADDPGRERRRDELRRREPRAGHVLLRRACVHERRRRERELECRDEGRAVIACGGGDRHRASDRNAAVRHRARRSSLRAPASRPRYVNRSAYVNFTQHLLSAPCRQLQTRDRCCLLGCATQGQTRRKTVTQSLRSERAKAQDSGVAGQQLPSRSVSSLFLTFTLVSVLSAGLCAHGTARGAFLRAVRTVEERGAAQIELGKPVERRGRKASGLRNASSTTAGLPHESRCIA